MRGRAGRGRAVVWLAIAAWSVAASGVAAAKDHGPPPGHAPGKSHGRPAGHVPPGHRPGGPHGDRAPASAPASTPAPPTVPAKGGNEGAGRRRPANRSDDGGSARPRAGTSHRRLHKSVRDLLPLDELGASAPAARGGSDASAGGGAVKGVRAQGGARSAAAHGTAGNDGSAGGGGDPPSGPLPFTGFALLTLALTGIALLLAGGRLRRSARPKPAPVSPAPPAERPGGGSIGPRHGRSLAALALVGLLGVGLLAAARRAD
ncbi:MAG: hypothetical protein QOJ14_1290 [Thermoleophilaceae bacterium]|nr:hypothetical protein [Thermoleophilaceae bacterium]